MRLSKILISLRRRRERGKRNVCLSKRRIYRILDGCTISHQKLSAPVRRHDYCVNTFAFLGQRATYRTELQTCATTPRSITSADISAMWSRLGARDIKKRWSSSSPSIHFSTRPPLFWTLLNYATRPLPRSSSWSMVSRVAKANKLSSQSCQMPAQYRCSVSNSSAFATPETAFSLLV